MSWAILSAGSLAVEADSIKSPATQIMLPGYLGYVDVAIIAAGMVLALHGVLRYLRGRKIDWAHLPSDAEVFPLEVLLAPMLVYMAAAFGAYALLSRKFPPPAPADASTLPDYASLLTNHVALLAGGAASYLGLRSARALRAGTRLRVLGDVAVPLLIALALCHAGLYLIRLLILELDPGHVFPTHAVLQALSRPDRPAWLPWAMWIGVTVIAPVAEELFFRGVVLTALVRLTRRPGPAVLLGGFVFGMAHFQQPQEVLPLALFGVILGVLFLRTRSLLAPILIHALFNAKTMLWLALGAPA